MQRYVYTVFACLLSSSLAQGATRKRSCEEGQEDPNGKRCIVHIQAAPAINDALAHAAAQMAAAQIFNALQISHTASTDAFITRRASNTPVSSDEAQMGGETAGDEVFITDAQSDSTMQTEPETLAGSGTLTPPAIQPGTYAHNAQQSTPARSLVPPCLYSDGDWGDGNVVCERNFYCGHRTY